MDVAIISSNLFSRIKENLYSFTSGLNYRWNSNETYRKEREDLEASLYKYMAKGWFRPDFKPPSFEIGIDTTFENLKKEVYQNTGRKLGLAIYESWFYFKEYHIANLKNLSFKKETSVL